MRSLFNKYYYYIINTKTTCEIRLLINGNWVGGKSIDEEKYIFFKYIYIYLINSYETSNKVDAMQSRKEIRKRKKKSTYN